MRTLPPLLLALLCVTPGRAAAVEEKEKKPEPPVFELGEVLVEAEALTAGPGVATGGVDAAAVRTFERLDMAEALRLSPGVAASVNGPRNEAGVMVRGFDLRQTPFFMDGIPVYVPYDGYADLRRFSTADVSGIAVEKGFSSALYGANTLGGAINVVSRRPQRAFEGDLLTGWMEDGWHSSINAGARAGDWYFQAGGSLLDADSFPLSGDFTPTAREDGGMRDNAWRRDYRLSARVGYTPNATDEYALGYVIQRGEKGNPVYTGTDPRAPVRYWQWPQWDKQTVYFVSETKLGDTGYIKPRLYYDQFENALFAYDNASYTTQNRPSSFRSYYDDYTWGGSVEAGFKPAVNNTLKAAVHGKLDHHHEHNAGAAHYIFEDTTWSFGLEDTHEFNTHWRLVAGASYDLREVREAVDTNTGAPLGGGTMESFNPQIGLFYEMPGKGTLHLTAARKSRFPTVKDRYSYRLGQAIPNPDLEPESALHLELGYTGDLAVGLTVRVNLFAAEIDDTIQRVDDVQPGRFQLQNVGESRHRGVEAGLDYSASDSVKMGVSYTYLDRENISQPAVALTDTPRHSLMAYAELRALEWLSVIPTVEYASSRYSTSYGVEAGAYWTAGLKLECRLREDVTLSVGAQNLFDRDYELTEGYPEPGRTFFANLHYTW